ncbi:S-adenosyl-L-methionine-dependent methyltransferase [Hypoxylon sp. NC1633]|nr:S-adenosyl-L-methionine-dependent methyltransferase [Hypoxylon sp. NC1633]
MPRLPPSLFRRAHNISPHLAALLPACRDLASARNELRWIREHVARVVGLSDSQPQSRFQSRNRSSSSSDNPRRVSASSSASASAEVSVSRKKATETGAAKRNKQNALLRTLCRRRGAGVPLQYILGSQPFGDLDIRCRPGVLIPRPETEAWAAWLARVVGDDVALRRRAERGRSSISTTTTTPWRVKQDADETRLGVLDLCSGSGCIALLLDSLLRRGVPGLRVTGFDVEPRAVALARENLEYNVRRGLLRGLDGVEFGTADIFAEDWLDGLRGRANDVDVLVSNPPYISARGFDRDTGRSVRNFEPRLALVPLPSTRSSRAAHVWPEDVFYDRLLEIAAVLRPRFAVFEVGGLAQALRVVQMARSRCEGIDVGVEVDVEIWRDWPDMRPREDEPESVEVGGMDVLVRGSGHGRAVFIRRSC